MCSTNVHCLGSAVRRRRCAGRVPVWLAGVIAALLLVSSGVAYRLGAAHVEDIPAVTLPRPLKDIPLQIGDLIGRDLEIPATTREYMENNFADDYISRRYAAEKETIWADVYVVYCSSQPAGLLGHRPRVCYPGNGWIWDETSESQLVLESGRQMPCLVHRFHRPAPDYRNVVVLSFYVLNGSVTLDEDGFSGFWGRRLNLAGNPARYVAQVQVSSVLEQSARTVLGKLGDTILAFLPQSDKDDGAGGPEGTTE